MFNVFTSLKNIVKLDSICIDNFIFRLHYKFTFLILIVFSIIVSSKQFIGDPIICRAHFKEDADFLDTYCWVHSTYTLDTSISNRFVETIGINVPYPGVRSFPGKEEIGRNIIQPGIRPPRDESDAKIQFKTRYYVWVPITLFLQSMCFYFPHYLWKTWEGGRLKALSKDLTSPIIELCEDKRKKRVSSLVKYFRYNLNYQNLYAVRYIVCEILNLINVISQIYFIDYFLDGEFSDFGLEVLTFMTLEPEERYDPMARVFPLITICSLNIFGPSGSIENTDTLCVLPINIYNERIFVFLWFWFVSLIVLTGLCIIYRVAIVISPVLRYYLIKSQSRLSSPRDVRIIVDKFKIGDWFLLYQLSKNIDSSVFEEVLYSLSVEISDKESTA